VSRNIALVVEPPEAPDHEVKPLTVEEAHRLLDAATGDRLRARWVLGLSLGLRQSEVLGLWWDDIDLDAATLRVRRQLLRRRNRGDALTFGPPKSARSRRVLSLPAPLVAVPRDHKSTQDTSSSSRRSASCAAYIAVMSSLPLMVSPSVRGVGRGGSPDGRRGLRDLRLLPVLYCSGYCAAGAVTSCRGRIDPRRRARRARTGWR
jgi:integrase